MNPTLFYGMLSATKLIRLAIASSYPGLLDLVRYFDKELLVFFGVLTADKDLDGEAAALDLFKVFG